MDKSWLETGIHIQRRCRVRSCVGVKARTQAVESDETPRGPSIPQELPAPKWPRSDVCHKVAFSLARQTCAVSCMLPPVESVLTSVHTDTRTRVCYFRWPSITRSSDAYIDLRKNLVAAHVILESHREYYRHLLYSSSGDDDVKTPCHKGSRWIFSQQDVRETISLTSLAKILIYGACARCQTKDLVIKSPRGFPLFCVR